MTCLVRNRNKLRSPTKICWPILCSYFVAVTLLLSFYPKFSNADNEDSNDTHVQDKYPQSWNDTWEDKLKQNLLIKYDKFARPTQHWNTTNVNLSLIIFTVHVDDKTNVLAVNAWNKMEWNDDKLKWDPSEFGGLSQITLGSHEVWLPDIHILNSAAHGMEYYGDRHCVLREDGSVYWVVPTIFHGSCNLDFTFWPFEMNTCKLNFMSWTYDGNQVDLKLDGKGVDMQDFIVTSEWDVKNVTAKRHVVVYHCCPEPYITLEFIFKLSRASDLYYHIVFIPIFSIVFLMLITFWLRPQSETKLIINAAVVLIVVLYLMYFGTKVPARSDSLPLIVRFYSGCLYQATISLIISAFVMNSNKLAYYFTVPRIVRRFLMGKAGRYLGLGQIIHEIEYQKSAPAQEMSEDHLVDISMSTTNLNNSQQLIMTSNLNSQMINNLEWTLVATAVDRIVFVIFCFIFMVMALFCVHSKRFEFSSDNVPIE